LYLSVFSGDAVCAADTIPDFCDMCGRNLDDCSMDYRVVIEVISGNMRKDLAGLAGDDPRAEIRKIIEDAENKSEAELMDGVYRKMAFTICPACQKKYVNNPIPRNFKGKIEDEQG
jgi:hypothetical protein